MASRGRAEGGKAPPSLLSVLPCSLPSPLDFHMNFIQKKFTKLKTIKKQSRQVLLYEKEKKNNLEQRKKA